MAYKTLIFGVDDIFDELKPHYAKAIKNGILDIVAYAIPKEDGFLLATPNGNAVGGGTISQL